MIGTTNYFDKGGILHRQKWVLPGLLVFLSGVLFLSGLSIRSLWGSEGRWAEVAREMVRSDNYFLPTINGQVYFDKPLLSYWVILLASFKGVVTEGSSRLPSALSGIGAVLLTFAVGRRLFGSRAGAISGMFLLTSVMYLLWSRTASAELLNLFAVWLALWIFLRNDFTNRSLAVISLYVLGAVAAFCKGLVGPAVIFSSIGFSSANEILADLKGKDTNRHLFIESVSRRFFWILSRPGALGILAGSAAFTGLLLAPVVFTGSWQSVELMWRENVLRFFLPFDHIEPPHIYLKYIPLFFAPWTLFLAASLLDSKRLIQTGQFRRILMITLAVFLFYTASGSRRSYYILPILPALAILTGGIVDGWLGNRGTSKGRAIRTAAVATSVFPLLTGAALIYAYFGLEIPRHISQLPVAALSMAGAVVSIRMFVQERRLKGFVVLFAVVFIIEIWGVTLGMALGEKERTLKPFSEKVNYLLRDVKDDKIAFYQVEDSALIFYLNRKPLESLHNIENLKTFMNSNPDGFIIADMSVVQGFESEILPRKPALMLVERAVSRKKDDPLALFALSGRCD